MAGQLVEDTIQAVTDDLVTLYNGNILVQALVLEWTYPYVPVGLRPVCPNFVSVTARIHVTLDTYRETCMTASVMFRLS